MPNEDDMMTTEWPPMPRLAGQAEDRRGGLAHLGADAERGLSAKEARRRLARLGPNRIADQPETPLWRLALDQFRSLVVVLLLGAAAIAFTLGERVEAAAILVALVLNAAIG